MSNALKPLPDLTGGILAGGLSARMGGRDKGLMPFRGRPMVAWLAEGLAPQVDELLVSANRHGEDYAALGLTVVADLPESHQHGPLAGLASLLHHAKGVWLYCLPCDAIAPPAEFLPLLQAACREHAAPAAYLCNEDGAHPTCCLVATLLAPDALVAARTGMGLGAWLQSQGAVGVSGPRLSNINTPDDLRRLEAAQA